MQSGAVERLEPVLMLMEHSAHHKRYNVNQILRTISTPITLMQNIGIVEKNRLVAWCSWAFMTDEKADKFLSGAYRTQPIDWNEGDRLVMMDFIAPFGHTRQMYTELRKVFSGHTRASWIRQMKNNRRVEFDYGW